MNKNHQTSEATSQIAANCGDRSYIALDRKSDPKDGALSDQVRWTLHDEDAEQSSCDPEDPSIVSDKPLDKKIESVEELAAQPRIHALLNIKTFLAIMCCFCLTQGFAINGVNNVNMSQLERRYQLSSTQMGLEASFYDITAGSVVLLVGYFGSNSHQPRILALASLSLSLGSLTMALPHFMVSSYQPENADIPSCHNVNRTDVEGACDGDEQGLSHYLYVFLLGQALHGLAGTCLYTLAVTFIDGSVSSKTSPFYLGLFYASSALGPAIGYMLGGYFLDQYVDIPKPPPQGLTKQSPAWVGAWWIGFLLSSSLCFLIAFPLFWFPRELPGSADRRRKNIDQAHDHGSQHKVLQPGFGLTVRDVPLSFRLLLKNPVFVCESIISACEGFLLSGLSTFIPKFIANQFGQTPGWAAMLTGFIAVPGAALGQFLGGFIVRKLNLRVAGMIKMNLICSIAVIIMSSVFWARCDLDKIAGVTRTYMDSEIISVDLQAPCNSMCACSTILYEPVCINSVQYFSACHAGCPTEPGFDGLNYTQCSCPRQIEQHNRTGHLDSINAHLGKCGGGNCDFLYVFIPVLFLCMLSTFLMGVPGTTIILRSVADKQRPFALSVQQMCVRFLGTIPGPLVFGAILDRVCLVWQQKCEGQGSCWIYDNIKMGRNFFILILALKSVTVTMCITAYCLYKPPQSALSQTNLAGCPTDESLADVAHCDSSSAG